MSISGYTPKVKICGICDLETAKFCSENEVDFLGFNFSPESKRKIELNVLIDLVQYFSNRNHPEFVFLFYRNSASEIEKILNLAEPDRIQFVVGDESFPFDKLKNNYKLMPQIRIEKSPGDDEISKYHGMLPIFDSYTKGTGGGTGKTFDWNLLSGIKIPYLLAGGLNPANVSEAIRKLSPFGVDVASGVESSPGVKDKKIILEFLRLVRST